MNVASLFGRDACSDAFGDDSANSLCAPSGTLCCVRRGQTYPSCIQQLGRGWCCVGNGTNDDCYADQASECDSPNAVECVDLAPNTTKACCPRLTRCSSGYSASEDFVRCEIGYSDLMQLAATASDTSTVSSAITSQVVLPPSAAATTSSSSTTPTPTAALEQAQSTSAGTIAGATVGAVGGAALLGALAFFFYRRRSKAKYAAVNPSNGGDSNAQMHNPNQPGGYPWQYSGEPPRQLSELQTPEPPKELPSQFPPQELPGSVPGAVPGAMPTYR
ncbi:uncharacterized protein F4822DRAFT_222627 [Hypoxylon trugodes]|uniref:uncharacterized protein n=1 Tax=Hypoxylon trugodes TaxID=326681 RepID=UPI002197CADF|nr:uncharacterized protein F4822DRAFT_222627 [Hypoxylon trugodes]KAI1390056.1 hypothetical protein F4822DRAFT_222627 [Hypoxylon trugodes]